MNIERNEKKINENSKSNLFTLNLICVNHLIDSSANGGIIAHYYDITQHALTHAKCSDRSFLCESAGPFIYNR